MKFKLKPWLVAAAALCMGAAALAQGHDQDYPNRPVKILVGYVPGGAPDMVARALAQRLTEQLGQAFVVENRAGAGGILATSAVVKSTPDGYTLLVGDTGQLEIAPFTNKPAPYNPLRDLTPVAMVTSEPLLIVASGKAPYRTLDDLIRDARANRGKVAYGSSGIGTIHNIAAEVFKAEAGIDLLHVPYKGGGQSVPAALAGDVPVLVTSFAAAGAHLRAGNLRALAVTSPQRLKLLPDVPAMAESIKGYDYPSEIGVLAPPGLPPAILTKLAAAVKKATESPGFIGAFKDTATSVVYKDPAEYTETLKRNLQKYEKAVGVAKLRPE
jgi:tripartite-type tricarboxylate transporter receptor subunit TctC